MNRLEIEYGDRVAFLYLNAKGNGEQAFEAGYFQGHPAVVLLKPDGEEVWRRLGVVSYNEMETQILLVIEEG